MNPKTPGEGIPQPDNRFRIITGPDGETIGFVVPDVVDKFKEDFMEGLPLRERPPEPAKETTKPAAEPDQNPEDYRFSKSQILGAIGRDDFGTDQFDALVLKRLGITPLVKPGDNPQEGEPYYTQADVERILGFMQKNDERKKKI